MLQEIDKNEEELLVLDQENLIKTFENLVKTNFQEANCFEDKNNFIMKQTTMLE